MCDCCHQSRPTTGAIINGKFGQYCSDCRASANRQASPRSAQYARDRDREANEKDLLQPWDSRGNPSTEFIRNYPEEAAGTFTKEEFDKFG